MQHVRDLVALIEDNTDVMAQRWLEVVRRHSATPTYHRWDVDALLPRAKHVFADLTQGILKPTMKKAVADRHIALGRQRCREGFGLSEVMQAMIITRRVLWFRVQSEGFIDASLSLNRTVDLYNRVLLFFDRAIYYIAKGFEEESGTSHEAVGQMAGVAGR